MKNIKDLVEKIIHRLTEEQTNHLFCRKLYRRPYCCMHLRLYAGASAVLNGSCVTYSNDIKHLWLGVSNEVLEKYGAVSQPCVSQMLEGIQKLAGSDYAIAVSGIAGPTGGTELKPVGTVYIGLQTPFSQEVFHCHFNGSREAIQEQSTVFAIEKLAELLNV